MTSLLVPNCIPVLSVTNLIFLLISILSLELEVTNLMYELPASVIFKASAKLSVNVILLVVVTPPKTTGSLSNQQYKEMTTQLQQNEAFMAITPFVMAEKVHEELVLSDSVNLQEYAIMYKRPNELSRLILFVRPYSSFVSLCGHFF